MAITDVFKTKQFKSDIERLTSENQYLNSLLTPEMRTAVSIKAEIQKLTAEKDSIQADIEESKRKRQDLVQEIFSLDKEIEKRKNSSSLWTTRCYIRTSDYTPLSTI